MELKLFYVQASIRVIDGVSKYSAFTIASNTDDAITNVKQKHLNNGSTVIIGIYACEYSPLERGVVFGSEVEQTL